MDRKPAVYQGLTGPKLPFPPRILLKMYRHEILGVDDTVTMLRGNAIGRNRFLHVVRHCSQMPTHYALVDFENVQPDLRVPRGRLTK